MTRALIVLAVLLAASPAAAEPLWVPPASEQTLPPDGTNPVYRLIPSARIAAWCATVLHVKPRVGDWLHACSGWYDGRWLVALRSDVPPIQQGCDARHEFGHERELELTGDANFWHVGWTWEDCA